MDISESIILAFNGNDEQLLALIIQHYNNKLLNSEPFHLSLKINAHSVSFDGDLSIEITPGDYQKSMEQLILKNHGKIIGDTLHIALCTQCSLIDLHRIQLNNVSRIVLSAIEEYVEEHRMVLFSQITNKLNVVLKRNKFYVSYNYDSYLIEISQFSQMIFDTPAELLEDVMDDDYMLFMGKLQFTSAILQKVMEHVDKKRVYQYIQARLTLGLIDPDVQLIIDEIIATQ